MDRPCGIAFFFFSKLVAMFLFCFFFLRTTTGVMFLIQAEIHNSHFAFHFSSCCFLQSSSRINLHCWHPPQCFIFRLSSILTNTHEPTQRNLIKTVKQNSRPLSKLLLVYLLKYSRSDLLQVNQTKFLYIYTLYIRKIREMPQSKQLIRTI